MNWWGCFQLVCLVIALIITTYTVLNPGSDSDSRLAAGIFLGIIILGLLGVYRNANK